MNWIAMVYVITPCNWTDVEQWCRKTWSQLKWFQRIALLNRADFTSLMFGVVLFACDLFFSNNGW